MPDQISIIDDTGVERFLGNLVPPAGLTKAWPVYGDVKETPMIDPKDWERLIGNFDPSPNFPHLPYVHNQDGIGQCNADATVTMGEACRIRQLGYRRGAIKLSAADLYDRINGGSDRGSLLEDAMAEMLREGVGTAETAGTLWRRGMRGASKEERNKYRFLEVFICPTVEHVMSASISGFFLNSGIMWYSNYTPDEDGWLPVGRGGAGGHAIFGYKPAMRKVQGKTQFGVWHQNSWSSRWGLNGKFVIPLSAYSGPVGGWFAVRSMVDEGGVVPIPSSR